MPPRSKRPAFGGSLLGVPAPLPDEAAEPAVAEPTGEPTISSVAAPAPSVAPPVAPGRQMPPTVLRLNHEAAPRLWDAYLVAKRADPFLSFAKFASDVVLRGLEAR